MNPRYALTLRFLRAAPSRACGAHRAYARRLVRLQQLVYYLRYRGVSGLKKH